MKYQKERDVQSGIPVSTNPVRNSSEALNPAGII
jgi:hypothetical protein